MKKIVIAFFCVISSSTAFAQYTLTTPDGKTVQLNANGTWAFKDLSKDSAVYVSVKKYFKFTYNSNSWIKQETAGSPWDAEFKSKNGVITASAKEFDKFFTKEKIEELLRNEYKDVGTIKRFEVSERTLNNMPVNYYTVKLNVLGDVHTYSGVVISNENGSFQLSVGGQDALFVLNKEKIEDLLFEVRKN